jgi:4-hydroxy-tetrahydrodipicolinate reductase
MIRVVVSGAAGRMGKQVIATLVDDGGFVLVGALEATGHGAVGSDAGTGAGTAPLGVPITDDRAAALGDADVVIDFSTPDSALAVVAEAARRGLAVVTGTTGHSDEGVARIAGLAKDIPVVMTPNMSAGVNLLFALSEEVARVLGDDFDVEIIEAHHNQKVDAPSGTAKRLMEIIARARGKDPHDAAVHGREGMVGKRQRGEIGVHAVRAGDIVGEHTVIFGTTGERIELVHRFSSRMPLARGAVRAATWVVGKKPGFYDMLDVLDLRAKK